MAALCQHGLLVLMAQPRYGVIASCFLSPGLFMKAGPKKGLFSRIRGYFLVRAVR